MKIPNKHFAKVAEITNNLYLEWKDKLIITVPKIRDVESGLSLKDFINKALTSTEITEEDRKRFNSYLDSGLLEEKEEAIDEKASLSSSPNCFQA